MINPSYGEYTKASIVVEIESTLRLYEEELDQVKKDLYSALEKVQLILLKLHNHANDVRKSIKGE